ncbi:MULTISPECIES: DUF1203 domain-containing protein [unclassified Nocardioides]|uniref:DUF1203 domain-containing protein n=1 Tax=unclassified Nocardioides TaxID=2615069 RepID=UPI003605C7DE
MDITIHALPTAVLEQMRGTDPVLPVERVVAAGREPLRCCLRGARDGEALLLAGYEPPLPASPYVEKGAVFVHAEPCDGPADDGYPRDWVRWPQVLRAYDERGWIHPATRAHDGTDPAAELAAVLAEPGVVVVHSRNVAYGCYMFAAARAS